MQENKTSKQPPTEEQILYRMAAWCSGSERCKWEVQEKVRAAGLPQDACQRITDYLQKEKYIDEQRYCKSFINDKLRFRKWGRTRIMYEMMRKKLPQSVCRDMLAEIDEEQYRETLLSLLAQKKKSIKGANQREVFDKLYRFGASRGYESGIITACIRQLTGREREK